MLQHSKTVCFALLRCAQRSKTFGVGFRIAPVKCGYFHPIAQNPNFCSTLANAEKQIITSKDEMEKELPSKIELSKTLDPLELAISKAGNLDELLSLIHHTAISEKSLDAILAIVADWTRLGKVQERDYKDDPRFLHLNKVLNRKKILDVQGDLQSQRVQDELSAVLRVQSLAKATVLVESFDSQQCLAVLKNLAAGGHRPLPLISRLLPGILGGIPLMNMKDLSDLLFALSKLNYSSPDVMELTCIRLKKVLKTNDRPAPVGSAITSLRNLHWRDEDLMDDLSQWVGRHIQSFRNPASVLQMLAVLNYLPSNHKNLFKAIWGHICKTQFDVTNLTLVAHCLLVLNKLEEEQLKHVLQNESIRRLDPESTFHPTLRKLQNLNGAAQTMFKNYSGSFLPTKLLEFKEKLIESEEKQQLRTKIANVLFRKMDSDLYRTCEPTNMGFLIDLVCSVDTDGKPVPLSDTTPQTTRVALLTATYKECCEPSKTPVGYKLLEERLLQAKGYKVIIIPYYELSPDKSAAEYHNFFETAFKGVLEKTS